MARAMPWKQTRETFLTFFAERGHTIVPSSSLVPAGDPTLLFANAGMVQFKDVFLGREQRPYDRAVSVQKVLRVSGHHNDLEEVGPSPRHHTFFQMCGNFAFGAYFKREAIRYAWELVTGVYGIDPHRLYFTVLRTDDESFNSWRGLGVPEERIFRMGEKTNFWMMGPVGPVGPNSEIHYDWGPEACTCRRPDCSVGLDNDCLRWLEIWNLVFMQYDQAAGGTRTPLPRPGVDTGMGLERIVSVLQQTSSNYDTDLFTPITARTQALLGHTDVERQRSIVTYRVIADHARAAAFLLADGVMPGNEGRAYVLRMIMRRAIRFGTRAGLDRPFLGEVADSVVASMGDVYPELVARREFIRRTVEAEEERFSQTLAVGLTRVDEAIASLRQRRETVLPGEVVFRLYDTYGFPVEMTRDLAREQGLTVDDRGFEEAMARQRERARAASGFQGEADGRGPWTIVDFPPSEFLGYRVHQTRARILALVANGERMDHAGEGEEVEVVLDRSPFYPEGGGQVGDRGLITSRQGEVEIADTQRAAEGIIVHLGRVARGTIRVGDGVRAVIDSARRRDIMRNHTATHLLHAALHELLGEHAKQAGSLVAPDRLRFDFTHLSALTEEEREAVEQRVNEKISEALPVSARVMGFDEALRRGAMALFGEKYGERVRVVEVDGYSRELCGGTHLTNTAQIGLFKIVAEGSAAAGIRRIEGVTGRGAVEYSRAQEAALQELARNLRVSQPDVVAAVRKLQERNKQLEREQAGTRYYSREDIESIIGASPTTPSGIRLIFRLERNMGQDGLRRLGDQFREAAPSSIVALGSESNGKVSFVTMVTPTAAGFGANAAAIAQHSGSLLGGSGGGNTYLGQAGGRDPSRLAPALEGTKSFVWDLLTRPNDGSNSRP